MNIVSRSSDTKNCYRLLLLFWGVVGVGSPNKQRSFEPFMCLDLTIGLTKPSPASLCTHKKQPRRSPVQVTMAYLTNLSSSPSYLYASPSFPSTAPFFPSGISGLSFDSLFLSPLLFFSCLILLLFLSFFC